MRSRSRRTLGSTKTRPSTTWSRTRRVLLYPHDYIAEAARRGITYGTSATAFSPYVNISRVQLITMATRAARTMKPDALKDPPAGYTGSLPGFDSPDHTANLRLAEYSGLLAGLVGYGPGWDPWHDASRAEAAQVMWNLYGVVGGPRPALLAVDDFSDPASGWTDKLLTNSSVGYFEGRYAITLLKPGVSTWSARDIMLSDATIEIDASPIPGQAKTEYGLKIRLQGNGDCYQLTVGSDGSVGLWRVMGQARLALIPKQAFAAVKKEGTNHLTVTFKGDRISRLGQQFPAGRGDRHRLPHRALRSARVVVSGRRRSDRVLRQLPDLDHAARVMTETKLTPARRSPGYLRADRRTHILLAQLMWTIVGSMLLALGVWWVVNGWGPHGFLYTIPFLVLGVMKGLFILDRTARRTADRIEERGDDQIRLQLLFPANLAGRAGLHAVRAGAAPSADPPARPGPGLYHGGSGPTPGQSRHVAVVVGVPPLRRRCLGSGDPSRKWRTDPPTTCPASAG